VDYLLTEKIYIQCPPIDEQYSNFLVQILFYIKGILTMLINLLEANYVLGGRHLLNDANFIVNDMDRIALIGRNGCGKSTLLKILAGSISIDAGTREVKPGARILLVKQELPVDDKSPLDYLKDADEQLSALNNKIDAAEGDDIAVLYEEIEVLESERYGNEATLVLLGLGISKIQQERPMRELSGGIRMRIALASALLQRPDLLILDEPTNHLDLAAIIWLTEYLKTYPRPFVMVSHDRTLLTAVINTTYHLKDGELTCYNGNFNTYLEQRNLIQGQAISTNLNTDKKVVKLQKFVDSHKSNPKWARIARTREGWINQLENDRPALDQEAPPIPIAFAPCSELSDPIVRTEGCAVYYGDRPILSNVTFDIQSRSRIGILGRNGEGKSTLVRMIMGDKVRTTGLVNCTSRLRIGYFSQEQSDTLQDTLSVFEQLKLVLSSEKDEGIFTHLIHFGFTREHCAALIGTLSGGEKTRLSFALLAAQRPQLIIMDEPTNHLDFETRQSLISAINQFNGAVLLVSHDWELLETTMSHYLMVSNAQVSVFDKGLEHYKKVTLNKIQRELNGQVSAITNNMNAVGIFNTANATSSSSKKATEGHAAHSIAGKTIR